MVNGKLEAKLADGTYYALQEKMEEMDQNYNGIKWASFNAGREEPRFAGLASEETEEEKDTGEEKQPKRRMTINEYNESAVAYDRLQVSADKVVHKSYVVSCLLDEKEQNKNTYGTSKANF